ncbi:MAG: hypothetical protein QGG02_04015 [Gammaproteobacteria bacterium]|jgi:hypothetical protein|nr:hypothetical protein [Gammaproteobacteria bacterium]
MRKVVWTSFGVALILVNLIAEIGEYYTGIYVNMLLRISVIVSVTIVAMVFYGAIALVNTLEKEKPLSGHVRDTLGEDRKKDEA